jgi:hypothetical protein
MKTEVRKILSVINFICTQFRLIKRKIYQKAFDLCFLDIIIISYSSILGAMICIPYFVIN